MVSLNDFLKIMEGAEVTFGTSCWDETIEITTDNFRIYIDGKTYSSVEEVYKDYKKPKVTSWAYTQPYLQKEYFEIWCQE